MSAVSVVAFDLPERPELRIEEPHPLHLGHAILNYQHARKDWNSIVKHKYKPAKATWDMIIKIYNIHTYTRTCTVKS